LGWVGCRCPRYVPPSSHAHVYITPPSTIRPSLYPPRRTPLIHFKGSPWYPSPSFVSFVIRHSPCPLPVDYQRHSLVDRREVNGFERAPVPHDATFPVSPITRTAVTCPRCAALREAPDAPPPCGAHVPCADRSDTRRYPSASPSTSSAPAASLCTHSTGGVCCATAEGLLTGMLYPLRGSFPHPPPSSIYKCGTHTPRPVDWADTSLWVDWADTLSAGKAVR